MARHKCKRFLHDKLLNQEGLTMKIFPRYKLISWRECAPKSSYAAAPGVPRFVIVLECRVWLFWRTVRAFRGCAGQWIEEGRGRVKNPAMLDILRLTQLRIMSGGAGARAVQGRHGDIRNPYILQAASCLQRSTDFKR